MSWQWIVLIIAILAWIAYLKYLANKKEMAMSGMKAMEDGNVLVKMFMDKINNELQQ